MVILYYKTSQGNGSDLLYNDSNNSVRWLRWYISYQQVHNYCFYLLFSVWRQLMRPQLFALLTAFYWGVGGYFEKKGLQLFEQE
jgi:hypothetical protein